MMVTTKPVKISGKKKEEGKANTSQDKGKTRCFWRSLKQKYILFLDSDVSGMLNELL